jgi:hypothetical protein
MNWLNEGARLRYRLLFGIGVMDVEGMHVPPLVNSSLHDVSDLAIPVLDRVCLLSEFFFC